MNQIVTSLLWSVIFGNVCVIGPMTVRYLFAEAPDIFCQFDFYMRSCVTAQILLLSMTFVIVRYICVFHSKNITAIQDEFWICFINIWTWVFCLVAYFVAFQITNKRPRHFYFCLGKMSMESQSDGPFVDYIWYSSFFFDLIVLLFVGIKLKISDYQKKYAIKIVTNQGHYFRETTKSNLITFTEGMVALIEISLTVIIPIYKMEYSDLDSLSTFPGYLWIYTIHLYCGNIASILALPLIYAKNDHLWNFAKRVIRETILIRGKL